MSKAAVHLFGEPLMGQPQTACGMWVFIQRGQRAMTNDRDKATCVACVDRTRFTTPKEQTDDHQ